MSKISDRLQATKGITAKSPSDTKAGDRAPRTAPGLMMFDHQRARIAEAKLEAIGKGVVAIAELHEVPGRKRSLSKEDFEVLKKNLEQNSLGQPIIVKARKQGGYEIVAGHNRVEVFRQLGRTEIPAFITELEDDQVFKVGFYTNLITSNLADFEKYQGFKEVMKEQGMTQEKAADEAGVDRSLVSKLLNAFDALPKSAQSIFAKNPRVFGLSAVQELARAGEGEILAALNARIEDPKLSEKAAIKVALEKPKQPAMIEPRIIKTGKKTFAKITQRPGLISVKLENEQLTKELEERIYELIREFEQSVKVSHP